MSYIFIVNPHARSGVGGVTWDLIEPELKKRRRHYRVYTTEKPGHAEKIAREVTADGKEHTIVVLGGDGTVNEVLNGVEDPGKITLGYIPIGSSNDFARGLGIKREPMDALETVLTGERTVELDVGVISRNGKKRKFAVSAGIGFDAGVCHQVCLSRWKVLLNKLNLGKLSYAVVALDRLLKFSPAAMSVQVDGGKEETFQKAYFAAFMNLPCEGGGFRFCPEALPGDGKLDLLVVADVPRTKVLLFLPMALLGKHAGFRGVTIRRGSRIRVKSEKPLPIHTDGEPLFLRREVEVCVKEEKIRVITA
ncbi:MAG TPA: diacylglycerol kinase family lipid kinase [Candidatus Mediterraneibacter norfolkensis]|nr:diacylglycerol kinase family lipid kinase [Candidatus Mediterraneibacter norfolkensis]